MPILIHPGYHKTGTTFLQRGLFNSAPAFRQPWSRELIYRTIWHPEELMFNAANARQILAATAEKIPPAHIDVLSEENLSGNPFNGARERGLFARKLRAIVDEAKILFTIRNQPELIRSLYMQYLKMGGRCRVEDAFGPYPISEYFGFDAGTFAYHILVDYYASLFGAENILVLPIELLQQDNRKFVKLLTDFVGITEQQLPEGHEQADPVNVSIPPSGIPFVRAANFLRRGPYNETGFKSLGLAGKAIVRLARHQRLMFMNAEQSLTKTITENFAGRFADSNAQLQKFVPVSLKEFGYEWPQP